MSGLCEGRVAIVTGAARGRAPARAAARESRGEKVVNDLGAAVDGRGADVCQRSRWLTRSKPVAVKPWLMATTSAASTVPRPWSTKRSTHLVSLIL